MILNDIRGQEVLKYLGKGIFYREILEKALLFDNEEQKALFKLARERRDKAFPEKFVEVRSVVEISNKCRQGCSYCSMGKKMAIREYTIDESTLISVINYLYNRGRRVVLFQSGENGEQGYIDMVSRCIEKVKDKYNDFIIILCLGNLSKKQYIQLRMAGAERYILKFETSNPEIYKKAKPNDSLENRLRCIDNILEAGFSLGSGNIVGLPGQTITDIANDLTLMHKYNLSMNSATVFIPTESSAYMDEPVGDLNLTLNTMALMRIMNPGRLIPATSSLEKVKKGGQLRGLMAGANTVTIHDGTPEELKSLFPIYSVNRVTPNKQHFTDIVEQAYLKLSKEALYV
ncbi:MAG: radical SAM protein [Bacteroidales bacterium]|nr:MAG: radical SAM protein [Bacteroidales bacterium]